MIRNGRADSVRNQRLGVEPWAYLKDELTRLPTTPAQLVDRLPDAVG